LRIYNRYVLSLVIAAFLVNTTMAFLGQEDIGFYFIVNIISYLIITLLYTYFNPRSRRILNTIGIVFFAGFLVIAIMEIFDIISG
jgi:hypothetical protein